MTAQGAHSAVEGRDILVVGLGRSGEAAATALRDAGASVQVLDAADGGAAQARAAALPGVAVHLGADLDDAAALAGVDAVVASPGVPPGRGLLAAAVAAGMPVWSEVELAWRLSEGRTRLVAVTGTNGKTSTTELLAACLDAPTAGNIGTPLVSLLAGPTPPPLVVAELSSFQLHFADTLHPEVGVLLNLAPDHLDWHGDLRAYGDDKARMWARQEPGDLLVVNRDDAGALAVLARNRPASRVVQATLDAPGEDEVGVRDGAITARLGGIEERVVDLADLALGAPHQVANACAAVAAALGTGASTAGCAAALRRFRPGPHRLEHVATVAGVTYVNDSKATNPHAAAAALDAHEDVVLIAGGLAKGLDMEALAPALSARARALVTIGTSGPVLAALGRRLRLEVVEADTIERAVAAAARLAEPGWTVLLAPACASMDQFPDYAARGEAFRSAVAALRPSGSSSQRSPGAADGH